MKILLVGNPNAGKSTLFNRLTGGHARVGNWHGVTVGAIEGKMRGGEAEIVDLPGIYSAEGHSMEERFALSRIAEEGEAGLLFVAEYAAVRRTLPLLFCLATGKRRVALLLTKRRRFEREGGMLDREELSRRLGIPVLDASAEAGEIVAAFSRPPVSPKEADLTGIFRPVREGLSRADRVLLDGLFGPLVFLLLLLLAFLVTFAEGFPGAVMKGAVERFFSETLVRRAAAIASPVLRSLVADGILKSLGGVLCFLPQIALLYLFLILMEESGLLSRLAAVSDSFFSAIGLSGRAVFSILMGFGCTAAAILTTRSLDDRRMQRRVLLTLPYISCSAKLPVFLALSSAFFPDPFLAVLLLYALGVALAVLAALFLKGEEKSCFVMELAPLQLPRPLFVAKSLLFQLKQFIIKVATVILAFFLASWFLSSFDFSLRLCGAEESILRHLCGAFDFLFAPVGMKDWRIAYAALSGLVAKENVAGAIAMFYGRFPFGGASAFAFSVFLLACSPCVSAIAASAREVGWGRALLYALFETVTALLLSYTVYFCITGGIAEILLAATPLLALALLGRNLETLHGTRKHHPPRLHRRHGRTGVDGLPPPSQREGDPRQRQAGGGGYAPYGGRRGRLLHDPRRGGKMRLFRRL